MRFQHYFVHLLTALIFVGGIPLLLPAQKSCERIVVCSEMSLPPFLSDSIFKEAGKCYTNYLILNSVKSNEYFRLRIVPLKAGQTLAKPEFDYEINASMSYLRGRYNIGLKLTNIKGELLATSNSWCTKPDSICEAVMLSARMLGASDSMGTPLIDVITNYEKKAREAQANLALCPSMRFINTESIQLKPAERKQVKLEVSDADGVKIKGMKIQVKCSEGTLVQGTVLTNKDGIATIDLFAPFEETEYRVGALGEVTYASKRQGQIDPEPFDILVKVKEPITRLSASITVNELVEKKEKDSFKEYRTKSTTLYTNHLTLSIARGRIEYLQKDQNWSNIMSMEGINYAILYGLTTGSEDGAPDPIKVKEKNEVKSIENGKTRIEERSECNASTNGWDIALSIHPYDPMSHTGNVVSLTRNYVLTLEGVGNIRMHTHPDKYGSKGRVNGVKRNNLDELESYTKEANVGAPGFNYRKREKFETRVVVPLEIPDPTGLEKYLLNPQGAYTLHLYGSLYSEDLGYDEYSEKVEVVINMFPDEEE
ncbi:MAG: Ig-like domain-containing protein [Prolixibacteraceae bacterium]|nr:Ig-like domain-containing protein [Prolixibacteraceae bacterium]